ncbi:MAG TPA: universal stress protein [Polyangiaceae bacterium]|nr:universal stress protein [Polyangiaceae bacterium]
MAKVLFALPYTDRPKAALRSASSIAAAMNAELHVLSLLPRLSSLCARHDGLFDLSEARRHIEACVATCRQTRAWCEHTLGEPMELQRLHIRFGTPADEISLRVAQLDARLVVLAPLPEGLGSTAVGVAAACNRPVLVARHFSAPDAIIAATDLRDSQYRVLRQASALGTALGARVVAVHNASCLSEAPDAGLEAEVCPVPELPTRMLAELPASLDLVVTTELDPVGAILGQARHHHSGIIVVGTRARPGRRVAASVPSEVIDRSGCTVLVTSLDR